MYLEIEVRVKSLRKHGVGKNNNNSNNKFDIYFHSYIKIKSKRSRDFTAKKRNLNIKKIFFKSERAFYAGHKKTKSHNK